MMDYLRYYLCSVAVATGLAGFLLGGQWMWLGLGTFPALLVLDLVLGKDFKPRKINRPLLADIPLYLHILLMVGLYAAFAWRLSTGIGIDGGIAPLAALTGAFLSLMWLNILPNLPVVHELLHRQGVIPRTFAKIGGAFFADINRDISHLITHHIHFDTPEDSDTAFRGENIFRFMWRATRGSYIDAWETEKRRLLARGKSVWSPTGLILPSILAVAGIVMAVGLYGGWVAALIALAAMVTAKFVLEGLNFLQHYGLVREPGAVMGKQHTWNHLSAASRVIGYEITTHIDHHKNGDLRFDQLVPYPDAPQMPSIFICAAMAAVPPIWNRYAKKRLRDWDLNFATPAEQALAREANRRAGWPHWLDDSAGVKTAAA